MDGFGGLRAQKVRKMAWICLAGIKNMLSGWGGLGESGGLEGWGGAGGLAVSGCEVPDG